MTTVRIASAQTPEYRGDVDAALAYASEIIRQASARGARLLCFPECFLQGYLLDKTEAQSVSLDLRSPDFTSLIKRLPNLDMAVAIGMIEASEGRLFNTAVVIRKGSVVGSYRKSHLLKSESIFEPGTDAPLFSIDGLNFGINICFDTNFPDAAMRIAEQGGSLIVCLANNMMPRHKAEEFREMHNTIRGERCKESGLWMISSDIVGERDGKVSWGPTAVIDPFGQVIEQLKLEEPGILIYDVSISSLK